MYLYDVFVFLAHGNDELILISIIQKRLDGDMISFCGQ